MHICAGLRLRLPSPDGASELFYLSRCICIFGHRLRTPPTHTHTLSLTGSTARRNVSRLELGLNKAVYTIKRIFLCTLWMHPWTAGFGCQVLLTCFA